MHNIEQLLKVLHVREKEKQDAQIAHHHALTHFEKEATKLYELLKKKETIEATLIDRQKQLHSVKRLQDYDQYIRRLNDRIVDVQVKVNKARMNMEKKQHELSQAHVEMKKVENLIEKRKERRKMMVMKREQMQMDDIAMQQYVKQRIGG